MLSLIRILFLVLILFLFHVLFLFLIFPFSPFQELSDLEASISSVESSIAGTTSQIKDMEPKIAESKNRIGDRDRQKKIITDNIAYRKKLSQIATLEEELEAMSDEIASIEKNDRSSELYAQLRAGIDELKNKSLRNSGQIASLGDQVKALKGKLNSSDYKGINDRHRECMIQ